MQTTDSVVPSASAIADALALWGHDGWLTPPLIPVVGAPAPAIGRALTLAITAGAQGPGFSAIYDVLSRDLTGRVLAAAGRYAAAEDLVATALSEGEPLTRAYRHKKSIVDELRG